MLADVTINHNSLFRRQVLTDWTSQTMRDEYLAELSAYDLKHDCLKVL
jgi:hypothetical protein